MSLYLLLYLWMVSVTLCVGIWKELRGRKLLLFALGWPIMLPAQIIYAIVK